MPIFVSFKLATNKISLVDAIVLCNAWTPKRATGGSSPPQCPPPLKKVAPRLRKWGCYSIILDSSLEYLCNHYIAPRRACFTIYTTDYTEAPATKMNGYQKWRSAVVVSTAALHLAVPVCEFAGCPHLCVTFPAGGPAKEIENQIIQWVSSTECTDKNLDVIPGCVTAAAHSMSEEDGLRTGNTFHCMLLCAWDPQKCLSSSKINWVWSVIKNIIIIIKDHGQKVNLSYTEKKTQRIYPFYSTTWHKSLKLVHYWIQRNHQHALKSKHSKLTELSELHRHTQRISCFSSPLTAGARLKCTYWIFIKPCVISQGVGLYRRIIRMQPALFLELWFTHNPGLLGHSQPTAAAYQSLLKELSGSDTSRRQDALRWNLLAAWSLMCLS